jgi:hypothetical protein
MTVIVSKDETCLSELGCNLTCYKPDMENVKKMHK